MNNKKLLNDGVMNFFFKKEECRSLSNFWGSVVVIKDEDERREYSNGESCFHGEKFIRVGKLCTDENRKRDLLEYGRRFMSVMDPSIAKKMGRKFILNDSELRLWNELSVEVQNKICSYKYYNYEEVRDDLEKSKGKILVHPAMRCNEEKVKNKFWEGKAVVVDGKIQVIGRNMLGNMWMNFRDRIVIDLTESDDEEEEEEEEEDIIIILR